jgi:glucokinase
MHHAIGIDFGGTTIKSGLVRDGKILQHGTLIDTRECGSPEAIIDAIVAVAAELCAAAVDGEVRALGIGLPGIIDSAGGIVHELTNVPGWDEVPLGAILSERTGLPSKLENDVNAMAFGEWKYGAALNGQHVVCITLGTGVGGGLILGGRLYRGAQLGAGEIGHMSLDYRGVPGPYGNFGALERYVGNQQIADRAAALYQAAGIEKTADQCTPKELSGAAMAGDVIARALWEAVGTEVGVTLASVVWLLNPDTIVIGGGVAKAGELIFEPIRRTIRERTIDVFHRDLRVVPALLGNDAGIIGNAALGLDALGL